MAFLIWAPDFDVGSGGNVALHRLAHNLCSLGHVAHLACSKIMPIWLGFQTDRRRAGPAEMIIYPEVVVGNPFEAKRVVRWILNTPGVCGGDGVYGPDDLIMLWSDDYAVDPKYTVSGYLRAFRPMDHFRDFHHERKGQCYAIRKAKKDGVGLPRSPHRRWCPLTHQSDALCIDDYAEKGGDSYLLSVFNRCKQFICYDQHTMLVWIAEMCGCEAWVVNEGKLVRPNRFGFADTPGKIRDDVKAGFEQEFAYTMEQTRNLVELCRSRW